MRTSTIFYGGDLVLARRMHWRIRECKVIGNMSVMDAADFRLVNLECVVATGGEQGVDKGEGGPYYYHARPEMLNLITKMNVDAVLTANNHTGDYGEAALLEQKRYLDAIGMMHCGSGENLNEASAPIYVKINDLLVAIFSVDATMKPFAATETRAGIWYLPPKETELWRKTFQKKIAEARQSADIVIVAPHWGVPGIKEPNADMKTLGKILIDCGADAVLGCHSHNVHGIEKYKERPIIYDAGNFLFEAMGGEHDTCGFLLTIDRDGVKKINAIALRNGYGYVLQARKSRDRINKWFSDMCSVLGTDSTIKDDGTVEIDFEPEKIPRPPAPIAVRKQTLTIYYPPLQRRMLAPLTQPRPEWTVDQVPKDAAIEPRNFGALKLIGYRIPPECRTMTKRRMLYVETYWTIDEPLEADCRLSILGLPTRECEMPNFGGGMEHDFCDWMWPVNRWTPGIIYRERFGLRPPPNRQLRNVDLQIEIRVRINGELSEPFIDPRPIEMKLPLKK